MGKVMRPLEKITWFMERLTYFIVMISLICMSTTLILGVIFRYVLQSSLVGSTEISLFLLGWVTFLGASLSVKNNDMVSVTFLVDKLGHYKWAAKVISQVLVLAFSITFVIYGYLWIVSPDTLNAKSPELSMPMWIPFIVFPYAMFINVIFCIDNILKIVTNRNYSNNSLET
ncbi:TRAP transporter small permease [Salibacterium salarium]|uniref:TRAP transporter small permease n=1 Tax=Salibacterium salarium TaxID=284579 RepID=A0A3R9P2I8_9BACI|nr:TRAP transporter small permease [Salibacterium salarium]RSL31462.1 TRAP transporter small permease [Salibacterium salarium]